jgi:hypothetical protein
MSVHVYLIAVTIIYSNLQDCFYDSDQNKISMTTLQGPKHVGT